MDDHFGTIVRAAPMAQGGSLYRLDWDSKATAHPLHLRGLALHGDYIFAGFSPATIACIDRKAGKLVDYYFSQR